jgi:hypothetical protein
MQLVTGFAYWKTLPVPPQDLQAHLDGVPPLRGLLLAPGVECDRDER